MGAEMKEDNTNRMSKILIDSNRRLQETAQELLMAKQELEKKNKELEVARLREKQQKKQLEQELKGLKNLVKVKTISFKKVPEKTLSKSIARELSLKYTQLLRAYLKKKDLTKQESQIEELGEKLIEYGISTKGIIDLHLNSIPQLGTIGDLESRRINFEVRMVLLAVMTKYASLLREKIIKK